MKTIQIRWNPKLGCHEIQVVSAECKNLGEVYLEWQRATIADIYTCASFGVTGITRVNYPE